MGLHDKLGLPPPRPPKGPGPSDAERVEQLRGWWREGRIKGDLGELQRLCEQLRARDRALQARARERYDEIRTVIERGGLGEVRAADAPGLGERPRGRPDPTRDDDREVGRTQRITDADKRNWDRLLAPHGLKPQERIDFGRWLIGRHGEAEGHDHFKHSQDPNLLKALAEWRGEKAEHSRGRMPASAPAPGAKGAGPTTGAPAAAAATVLAPKALHPLGVAVRTGLRAYLCAPVQLSLDISGQLAQALDLIGDVESSLRGQGFVLKAQVRLADELVAAVDRQLAAWRSGSYRASVDVAFRAADEADRRDPEGLYGSDALSRFCAGIEPELATLETHAQRLQADLRQMQADVELGERAAKRMLDSNAFAVAGQVTKQYETTFMVWNEFGGIRRKLSGPATSIAEHHRELAAMRTRVAGRIIPRLFMDESPTE